MKQHFSWASVIHRGSRLAIHSMTMIPGLDENAEAEGNECLPRVSSVHKTRHLFPAVLRFLVMMPLGQETSELIVVGILKSHRSFLLTLEGSVICRHPTESCINVKTEFLVLVPL